MLFHFIAPYWKKAWVKKTKAGFVKRDLENSNIQSLEFLSIFIITLLYPYYIVKVCVRIRTFREETGLININV